MKGIYFTIKNNMIDNCCPVFLRQYFDLEFIEEPTWKDVIENKSIQQKYGVQGIPKKTIDSKKDVYLFEFHFPSLLNKEILELLSIMSEDELPTDNIDLKVIVKDITQNIPATIMSMFLPNSFDSGIELTWDKLFELSDKSYSYTAEYRELDDGTYLVNIPDILLKIWGLFVKSGYYSSTPEVALYASPEEVRRYLE